MANETDAVIRRPVTYNELLMERFLRDRMYKLYWKTRDGQKITLSSLSDAHLDRIIAFIDRNREAAEHLEDCDILSKDYTE